MPEMDKLEHEMIRQEIKSIMVQVQAEFEVMNNTLNSILEQAKRTNGRVTNLEIDTTLLKIIKEHKWLFALIVLGIYNFLTLIDIKEWIKLIF